ncbi:MAG TPA: hypothetical protein VJH55_02655 [Candidatus Paceibacterota bacterium]
MSSIRVNLEHKGPLTLYPTDHIATGGEASLYRKGGTVIKIYLDPDKMRRDAMAKKIKHLAGIRHDFIIAPQGIVTNDRDVEVGYYMPNAEGEALAKIFTNSFRQQVGLNDKDTSRLVDYMRDTVQFAHDHEAIMVDANELNWMVALGGKKGPEPRALDVDSWVIRNDIPAKVPKMPSIRDWFSPLVSRESDWYAWGIVTFQVFSGIHPFKGTLDGYDRNEMERRMKEKASVFTKGVKLNHAVRDFSCIPGRLRDWYQAVFQSEQRGVPPSPFDTGAAVAPAAKIARVIVTATGKLAFEKVFSASNDPVIRIFPCGVVLLASGALIDLATKRRITKAISRDCEVIKTSKGWLKGDKVRQTFVFSYIEEQGLQETPLTLTLDGQRIVRYENRMFLVTDKGLTELTLQMLGRPILSVKNTWGVMVNSTHWFDGVGVQDAMGAKYLIAPFSDSACGQIRVRELDGLVPVAARAGNRFISVIAADSKGNYRKIEFTFDAEYTSYQVWKGDATSPELNAAILPKGVCATILDDGELIIFVPSNGKVIKVQDRHITAEMLLSNWENNVVYVLDGSVWKVSMT